MLRLMMDLLFIGKNNKVTVFGTINIDIQMKRFQYLWQEHVELIATLVIYK